MQNLQRMEEICKPRTARQVEASNTRIAMSNVDCFRTDEDSLPRWLAGDGSDIVN